MSKKRYLLLTDVDRDQLEKEVNEAILEGYTPQGGVSMATARWKDPNLNSRYGEDRLFFSQAMALSNE